MRQIFIIFLIVSTIWGCTSAEKNASTPEGLYKIGQEFEKDERYDLAIQRYQEVKNKYPYSNYATMAELSIADSYYKQESFAEAQVAYQTFKDLHPKHNRIDYVVYMLGMSYYKQIPATIDRDLTLAFDAIKNFDELLNRFPTSENRADAQSKRDECIDKLAAKEEYVGDFYFKRENWRSALPRYESLIEKYPRSEYVPKAYSRAAISAYNLGDAEAAEKYLRVLESRYAGSNDLANARKVIRK